MSNTQFIGVYSLQKYQKQYSIKVKSPASHISATPPLPCLAALQVVSFTIGDMLKLLLCRAPQHCGVFCHAKYRGGVRRTEGLQK